eukprot:g26754.t1
MGRQRKMNYQGDGSFPRRTPRYFAGILNPRLCATISRSRHQALGVVVMDFPSRELCREIVRKNFLRSQVASSRVMHALDGWGEEYTTVLREIDAAAVAPRDEDYVQKLSTIYSRLLVQRSQFVIVSDDIRKECKAQRQVPSELHLTASQISRVWEKQMQRTKRKVREYMTQTRARPPTFVLWTNSTYGNFPENYLRHMRNGMRDEFRISGVPIHFMIRSTCMPKPRKKMTKAEVLKWKRMGPKQAKVAMNLNKKRMPRPLKQID